MARHRRKTAWFAKDFDYASLGVGDGQSNLVLITNAALHANHQDVTIIRIVGRLLLQHRRDSGGFKESMRSNYFLGINCLHEDVIMPNPKTAGGEEHWMWQGFGHSESTFVEYPTRAFDSNTIIGGSAASRATHHIGDGGSLFDLDVRSMRKAPEPCQLNLVVRVSEVEGETGAEHFVSGLLRILVKI